MLIAGTKPGDRWYRERLLLIVAIAVIAVLYVFRTPRDKFGLLVVAIVSFILLTTAANERMRRLRIYAKWLYD